MPAPPVGGRVTANAGPVLVPMGTYVYCIPLPDSPGRFTVSGISAEGTFQFQQFILLAIEGKKAINARRELPHLSVHSLVEINGTRTCSVCPATRRTTGPLSSQRTAQRNNDDQAPKE
jgi:hypothetical protein